MHREFKRSKDEFKMNRNVVSLESVNEQSVGSGKQRVPYNLRLVRFVNSLYACFLLDIYHWQFRFVRLVLAANEH